MAGLLAGPARAQYTFSDAAGGLNPYKQDFNTLSGNVALTSNHLSSLPEIYAEAEFPGYPAGYNYYAPGTISANDGSNATGDYYHFGYASGMGASDRSFGGIALTTTANGIGYVGIRFKNATSVTIQNLEVQYAMEQWYNSGRQDAAQVDVSYLTGSSVASLLQATGTWVSVPALQVKAPSTATVIASRDGNSAANRRQVSTTITGINLAPGQEVMLRWAYALNSTTNGNGLSIDDVVVTPETGIFYSNATGDLSALGTWGQNTDGSGTAPTSFSADNQIFYVMSANPGTNPTYISGTTADRIGGMASPTTANWTIGGANSKIVVGTAGAPATLLVDYTKNITGTIDVSPGSYLVHCHTDTSPYGPAGFTLGTLASTSTVEYNSSSTPHSIQPNQYGNLKVTGSGSNPSENPKNLFNTTIVTGTLTVGAGSNLVLGNNDLTIISSGSITGSATGYVVTNGTGRLRMLVPRASSTAFGPQVAFPVGSSFTSYTPVTLQQTTANSDDVFEVRVIDNVYGSYDTSNNYAPNGPAITNQVVNKTWLVSKEVPDNAANVTMTTQWNTGESSSNFINATAHINHYTGGAWDSYNTEVGVTGPAGGPFVVKRSNITSFSPFGVSSQPAGPLPVVLTAFTAERNGAGVRCAWTTASEVNSRGFDVERSLDGHTFTTLGTVAAAGTSATTHAYAFLDAHAPTTTAYYRLHQLDLDGTAAYSPVVAVGPLAGVAPAAGAAFPNPTAGPLTIWAGANVTQAEVLNVLGALVLKQQLAEPTPQVALDLSNLPAGVYLVRLATANGAQVVRVNKQ
ncbi:hypothetical protein A0257_05135 [Hymenobacter psoromatis]|nr:hypothetical protein A0257_05135 [Hymenobacter psoromatis]